MGNLILKDILIQKKTCIIILIVSFLIALNPINSYFVFMSTFSAYAFLTGSFYKDERANIMLNSLPISRLNIIVSKYLSIFVFGFIGMIVAFIFPNLMRIIGLTNSYTIITNENIFGSLIGIILLSCVNLPIYFKYGYAATRYVFLFLFIAIFSAMTILSNFSSYNSYEILTYLGNLPNYVVVLGISFLLLAIFIISFFISYFSYKNKDL
jgi:ABC-2 type transport system permease protein